MISPTNQVEEQEYLHPGGWRTLEEQMTETIQLVRLKENKTNSGEVLKPLCNSCWSDTEG